MKKLMTTCAVAFLSAQLVSCTNAGNSTAKGKCDTAAIIEWYKTQGTGSGSSPDAKSESATLSMVLRMPTGRFEKRDQGAKIEVKQANDQIKSYLTLHQNDPTYIQSLFFDSTVVGQYLRMNARYIKVMFAHTAAYATGHKPTDPEALTFIVTGVDDAGKYILLDNDDQQYNWVYDNVAPCPSICGNSSSTIDNSKK